MKTFEDFHPYLASVINGIAREFGYRGNWYGATHEDFSQEMIAWLLDNERRVAARFSEGVEDATLYAAKCLRNECKDYLATLKSQSTADGGDSQYDYGREELKLLLQLMFDRPDPEGVTAAVVESIADVETKFCGLGYEDQAILTAFHRDDYTNKMLAELYDISEANMSYRHNRAVLRLQKLLGSTQQAARTGSPGKRAVSNTAARAYASNTYGSGESS